MYLHNVVGYVNFPWRIISSDGFFVYTIAGMMTEEVIIPMRSLTSGSNFSMELDLAAAKQAFPDARWAIMYTPMEMRDKTIPEIRKDLERIVRDYGHCDLVFADIELDTSDRRVIEVMELCRQMSTGFDIS